MNFSPDDLQDMEDAIFYACIFLAKKQEDPRFTDDECKVMSGIITRYLRLRTKLSRPVMVVGDN